MKSVKQIILEALRYFRELLLEDIPIQNDTKHALSCAGAFDLQNTVVHSITRSGTQFTAKNSADATLFTFDQQDNNTTYSAASNGGLSLSNNQFSIENSGVTAGTYGPSADVSGANGNKISVPQITVNAKGQVTSVTNRTYTSVDSNTVYTHPTTAGNKHIPAGGSSGQILRWSAAGTADWGADNNTNTGSYMSCGTVSATVSSLAATSNTTVTSAAITPPSGYSILTVVPRSSSHAGVFIYSCTLSSSKVTFGVRNTSTAAQSNITVTATVFYYKSW